jgi:transcription termination factor Rho
MTEPADQPLLDSPPATEAKKASRRRTPKDPAAKSAAPKATRAKSAKPRAPRRKKDDVEKDDPAAHGKAGIDSTLPATERADRPRTLPNSAPIAADTPSARADHEIEEWRPSAAKNAADVPASIDIKHGKGSAEAGNHTAPSAESGSTTPGAGSGAGGGQGSRQYPVYVPRHVARQMEQEGKQAPLAVSAQEAAELQLPRVEPAPPRHEYNRGEHSRREREHPREPAPRPEPEQRIEQQPQPQVFDTPPREDEIGHGEGIVEISGKGFGFIRDPKRSFAQNPSDIFVTPETVRRFNLRDGQWIAGETRRGNRGSQLHRLLSINGVEPDVARNFPAFDELTVISPLERIRLETVPERYTTRILDLMAPIGKGQRGLIVAPPRTGKTTLLQHIADAVVKNHPELKLIILLVDERPEEVTDFKRTVPAAEIMASSNDMDVKSHTRIAQLAIERAKRLVEAGEDVFILLDSITRVGRAFNNAATGGRTMSGGLDSRALEIPRKIFAAARNTEEAGSLTIIATALIETNSRMDEVIFQEFKGTGNMELVLDRKISDQRIYPSIDIFLSGTRREELLVPADDLHKIHVIRRGLAGYKPLEAMERMLFFAKKFPTNAQMLREIPG